MSRYFLQAKAERSGIKDIFRLAERDVVADPVSLVVVLVAQYPTRVLLGISAGS